MPSDNAGSAEKYRSEIKLQTVPDFELYCNFLSLSSYSTCFKKMHMLKSVALLLLGIATSFGQQNLVSKCENRELTALDGLFGGIE